MVRIDFSRRSAIKLIGIGTASLAGAPPAFASIDAKVDSGPGWRTDFLTAILTWSHPALLRPTLLEVSTYQDMSSQVVTERLVENVFSFPMAAAPNTVYYWRLTPLDGDQKIEQEKREGSFRTGEPELLETLDGSSRYRNPRVGARWGGMPKEKMVSFSAPEPLSPWFYRKSFLDPRPPRFEEIKPQLPVPVLESDDGLIELYWYCWKTLFDLWLFPPTAPDHQAVANLLGARTWAGWGSTMVWDTAFMLHFARYAHGAYPFITALDNCYARQHENGFICRESDAQNYETYWTFPVNPPLFAWAEWEYFQLSGDADRLSRVLPVMVKHYEWWMRYQRRSNGLYWTIGMGDGMDDAPRNELMYYTVSATSQQALSALAIARIAKVVGRPDLVAFFNSEHAALAKMVNQNFWDEKHRLYNDLNWEELFITELQPGTLLKHGFMFWPLIAEIANHEGVDGLVAELRNPNSFDRASGVPSLSADSKEFREDGEYWKGAVWPPIQCIVQEGLRANGQWELARKIAEKYMNALKQAFREQQTITENLEPDSPLGHGSRDFVGWGGIGPVSNLIEYVLGFRVCAPERMIEWRIERTDRHGIQNLRMKDCAIDLTCARRSLLTAPCHIEVKSGGEFTLRVLSGSKSSTHPVKAGRSEIIVEVADAR